MAFVEHKPLISSIPTKQDAVPKFVPASGAVTAIVHTFLVIIGMFFLVTEPLGPLGFFMLLLAAAMFKGYFVVNILEAKLLQIHGKFKGVVAQEGFYWVNPVAKLQTVSLKSKIVNKINYVCYDRNGAKILISFSFTWKISKPDVAFFQIDNVEEAVERKAVSIVNSLSAIYPYQSDSLGQIDFRDGVATIAQLADKQLQDGVQKFGISIDGFQIDAVSLDMSSLLNPKLRALKAIEQAKEVVLALRSNESIHKLTPEEEKKLYLEIVAKYCSYTATFTNT